MNKEEILKALNWRYAVKIFDKDKKISEEDLNTILESGILSPSSLGLEPWKFIVVKDPTTRAKLFEVSNQPKVTDASHLIVLTYKTDIKEIIEDRLERTAKIQNQKIEELATYKDFLEGATKNKKDTELDSWLKAQSYIALGTMIYTASLLDIDNCPMEGFEKDKVDEILNLKSQNLKSVTMLALGYRGIDPTSSKAKIRKDFISAVEFI
ncbi:MAG: NAD(P)H-dependent oxidoreductase [Candidatus Paceibacterota bacterium]